MIVEELSAQLFPLANRFFRANGQKGKARGNERIFVLRNNSGSIVAALRACPKNSGYLLRSVQVHRNSYRQGYGRHLVTETVRQLSPACCWCYPYDHLQIFYEQCGFQLIAGQEAPDDIAAPYFRYLQQGHKFLLMTTC